MNKNMSFYYIVFSKVMLILMIFLLFFSYFNKTINIQSVTRHITGILIFSGTILYYQFYTNKRLLFLSCLLFFMSICMSLFVLLILKSMEITVFILLGCSVCLFYQANKYLYRMDNKLFLRLLAKVIFFNNHFKYKLAWLYYDEDNCNL